MPNPIARGALALALLLPIAAPLAAQHDRSPDLVQTAKAAGGFRTLLAAVDAAGLTHTLVGRGPYTVLAPTDEAFERLPSGTVARLLEPENRDDLRRILSYHVISGRVPASQVRLLRSAATLAGQRVSIGESDGTLTVDDATVTATDIRARNGIIHVIDRVLMPETKTIPGVAQAAGQFRTLLAAVKAAGLAEVLGGDGPFTVFAPTDEAFRKLPKGTLEKLLQPENVGTLRTILKYHVVAGRVFANDALEAREATTLADETVRVRVREGALRVNGARIVKADVDARNGVIHVIDQVLLPPDVMAGR